MNTFILLSAPAAAGKTTFANQYKSEHENVHIVSSDDVKEKLVAENPEYLDWEQNLFYKEVVWPKVDEAILELAKEREVTVILDATNVSNWKRVLYAKKTRGLYQKLILVYFEIPVRVLLKRNDMREGWRKVPNDSMMRLIGKFEKVSDEVISLYDEIYRINLKGMTKMK